MRPPSKAKAKAPPLPRAPGDPRGGVAIEEHRHRHNPVAQVMQSQVEAANGAQWAHFAFLSHAH
eukprot:489840-Pyramimonas_sp.AAC.1